jgi:hypothetical protein
MQAVTEEVISYANSDPTLPARELDAYDRNNIDMIFDGRWAMGWMNAVNGWTAESRGVFVRV